MGEENKKKFIDLDGLSHIFSKLTLMFNKKVDKIEGKGLSTNDLTDELKQKILNAGDSSFSGNYNDLINKPNMSIYAEKTQVVTDISTAVADKVTETQMNTAITKAVSNINKKEIVTSIAEMTNENVIYLLANEGTENNVYDEYIVINSKAEKIGTTEVDLTNYIKVADLVEITNEEIDTIFAE